VYRYSKCIDTLTQYFLSKAYKAKAAKQTKNMPRRNNRNQSLAARLASIPRVNLADREPHQIVGTSEWAEVRARKAFLEGRSSCLCISPETRGRPLTKMKQQTGASTHFIDKMLQYIDAGEWAQIEGGEHDKRWVNPKHYPSRIFETGRIKEADTQEYHYFPVSSTDDDPKGLALHHVVSAGGRSFTIEPNTWKLYETYVQRKRDSRKQRKQQRNIDQAVYGEMAREEEELYDQ